MPAALTKHLPGVPEANVKLLFGSITAVVQYPRGHPIREGVIDGLSFLDLPSILQLMSAL